MQAGYKILHLYDQEGNRTTIPNLSRSRLSNFVVPVPPLPEQQKIAHVLSTIQDAKEKTEAVIAAAKELKRSLMKYLFTYGPVPVQDAPNVRLKETEIGMIPEEWEIKKIKDINIYKNKTLNPSDTPDINFEYYSIPAYQDDGNPIIESGKKIHSSKLLLSENTVLFGKLNPRVEKVWIVTNINDELTKIGSTEWLPVLPIKSVNSKYLYYLMWSNYIMDKAKTMVTGSTPSRQRVNPKSFYNIRMPVPQINEQLKIVSIFNSIDEKISSESSNYIRLELLFTSMLEQLMTGTLRVDDLDLEGVA